LQLQCNTKLHCECGPPPNGMTQGVVGEQLTWGDPFRETAYHLNILLRDIMQRKVG
jgi:hypothetical protein